MTRSTLESWLRLSLAALPTAPTRELLRQFDDPQALLERALENSAELESNFGLSPKATQKLRDCARRDVSKQLKSCEKHQIRLVTEADFPPLLRQIGGDTPPFLFIRGEFAPQDERAIGIVGTRQLTEYGRGLAHKFALELAQNGFTVVSGLARGIDTAAHRGALDGGGRTIAATACGLDIVYPSENRELMQEIEQNGAVLSEWCPGTPPASWHFPARNRIIAGLSLGILVVEAAPKSGALITATFAAEHDRTVFAVPGNIHKPQSRGPHQLIKEGAVLVESVEEIVAYLSGEIAALQMDAPQIQSKLSQFKPAQSKPAPGKTPARTTKIELSEPNSDAEPASEPPRPAPPPKIATQNVPVSSVSAPQSLSSNENAIWLALEWEPRHMDDIAQDAGLAPGPANAALVLLELKGAAKRLPGNLFVKVAS